MIKKKKKKGRPVEKLHRTSLCKMKLLSKREISNGEIETHFPKLKLNAVIFMSSPQEQQDTCQDYILQCFAFKQQFSQ